MQWGINTVPSYLAEDNNTLSSFNGWERGNFENVTLNKFKKCCSYSS